MAESRICSCPLTAAVLTAFALAATGFALAEEAPLGHEPPAKSPSAEVHEGLSAELMYRLLVGDIALQRGDSALAARSYFEAARETRSPVIARRATEIGVASRQPTLALEAAKLWSELDPAAERPKQLMAQISAGLVGKPGESIDLDLKAQIERGLAEAANSPAALAEAFLQLNRILSQEVDKAANYKLIAAVAQPYAKLPEAHFAVALAALHAGVGDAAMMTAAIKAIDRALELRPSWDRGALLKAEILARKSTVSATQYLEEFAKAEPASRPVWTGLAQFYVEQKRFADARAIFQRLWDEDRSAREFEFGVAVLSLQLKDWETAEKLFTDLKQAEYGDNGVVEFHLAQVAEDSGRYELAIERYKAVPDGERAWLASLRIAVMMAKLNRLGEARRYLAELPAVTVDQQVQVRQTDAQILKDAGNNTAAFEVLNRALIDHPDEPDLLYDIAMVAEKLDKIDVAEARLKRLIELRPENAHALNALGYTLVDRTPRTAEGYDFIERAHKLEPADPFILDSMGWALFRLGKIDEAIDYLRRALAERPDAEIAAHLGEVLWMKGEHAAAEEVWQMQLKSTPGNAVLQETVRRFAR